MDSEEKEWVKATSPANGPTIVTVTITKGNLTGKASVKAYSQVAQGVKEARSRANSLIAALEEAGV